MTTQGSVTSRTAEAKTTNRKRTKEEIVNAKIKDCDELTDEQVGHMVRKERELFLENRELTV